MIWSLLPTKATPYVGDENVKVLKSPLYCWLNVQLNNEQNFENFENLDDGQSMAGELLKFSNASLTAVFNVELSNEMNFENL